MSFPAPIFQTTDPSGPNYRTRDGLTAIFTKDLAHSHEILYPHGFYQLTHQTPGSNRPLDRTLFLTTAASTETRVYALHIFLNMALVVPMTHSGQFSVHHLSDDLRRIVNYLVETVQTFVPNATVANHIGFKVFVYEPCTASQAESHGLPLSGSGFTLQNAATGVTALGEKLMQQHREYCRTLIFNADFSLEVGVSRFKDASTSTSDLVPVDPLPFQPSAPAPSPFAPAPAESKRWMPVAPAAVPPTMPPWNPYNVALHGAGSYSQTAGVSSSGSGGNAPIFTLGRTATVPDSTFFLHGTK
jgi:hypothetical protein